MIVLKQNKELEVYQVELTLKIKTRQNPLIAVLILAKETEDYYMDAEFLQEKLFNALPKRACENILRRLFLQGYLVEYWKFDGNVHSKTQNEINSRNYDILKNNGEFLGFDLSELGKESAIDKSYWIGEKGIYNVFVCRSNLLEQKVVRLEKVERSENDKDNRILPTPNIIRQYMNQSININKSEYRIEDLEQRCFQLKSSKCILEVLSNGDESSMKLSKDDKALFHTNLNFTESELKEDLLNETREFRYDRVSKVIRINFNKENLSFYRKVKINVPIFKGEMFLPIELENIEHTPSDIKNAELWYRELLHKNMQKYFLTESSFDEFAQEIARPIRQFFELNIPDRVVLIRYFNERDDAFYETAKLEAIDYLKY